MDSTWQGSVDISAPIERVYDYLADFPRHCEWAQTLERMEQKSAGDVSGVGAVYKTFERQAMHADRKPNGPLPDKAFKGITQCTVTDLRRPNAIGWKAHPIPVSMGIHAESQFELASIEPGTTRLTQTIHMHQPWLPLQIFSRIAFKTNPTEMEAKARAQWRASLDNIKHILEQPA